MGIGYMPFIAAIVITVAIVIGTIAHHAIEANERIEMIKRGFVPKGYDRIEQAAAAVSQPIDNLQPAAPPSWGSQEWNAGLPTTAMRERAKEQ